VALHLNGSVAFDLTGKVAWVTGAAKGQGARHAERLADAGALVGCLDVDVAGVETVAKGIRATGGTAIPIAADVSDWDAMQEAASQLRAELGPANVVVANAAIMMPPIDVVDTDVALWKRIVDVDLTGVFLTAKAAIPQLREGERGSLILISSVSGLDGGHHPHFGAYNAAKAGVIGLTRTLANELGAEGIRANAICPGWVDTPMLDEEAANMSMTREEAVRMWSTQHTIPRLVSTDEISDAVLWLASDAAAMVTGVALPIDGGCNVKRTDLLTLQASFTTAA
jgi:(+)-trans-carveol dehydrogenase